MEYHERPQPTEYAPFYSGYVERVPAGDLVSILRGQIEDTRRLLDGVPAERADYAYAPGKWTIKEVVGHLGDVERVLSYRALRIARGDGTELAGFDEEAYVAAAAYDARTLDGLMEELQLARRATAALFASLRPEAWTRTGVANGTAVSVRALACIVAGHELHHRALLRERYSVGEPAR